MVLGEINQGSAYRSTDGNFGGLCEKAKMLSVLLALILVSVTVQSKHGKITTMFQIVYYKATCLLVVTGQDESRISAGQIPPPGKYPSIARLVSLQTDGSYLSTCVLSILTRDWLVGSGNCFTDVSGPYPNPMEKFTVVVGDEIINETEPHERHHKVERFIVHHRMEAGYADYNKQTGDDIAVVKVTPPIMFSNRVSPANLPTCREPETPGIGLVAGFGNRADDLQKPDNHRLLEITNKIIPLNECSRRLNTTLDERIFCVEAINNMSTCFGDSGAPFFLVKSDAHMVQVGMMMAWPDNGRRCGVGRAVIARFVRLSSYVGWIHRRISGCGNHPWYNRTEYKYPDGEKPT